MIAQFSFSQRTSTPKLIVQGKDTLVVLSIKDVKEINKAYNDLLMYKELSDSLRAIIECYKQEVELLQELNKVTDGRVTVNKRIIEKQQQVIQAYTEEVKRQKKEIREHKIASVVAVFIGVGIAVLALLK